MGNPKTAFVDEVIIDLQPTIGPDGSTVWGSPTETMQGDVVLYDGALQSLTYTNDAAGSSVMPVHLHSTLPSERMAGERSSINGGEAGASSWDEIAEYMRSLENGSKDGDIIMGPGGELTVLGPSTQSLGPRSRLPKERMAALKPTISIDDVEEIRRIDPHNVEGWTPVQSELLDGWRFSLQVVPSGYQFVFLAFRSPNDGGRWRIWVLRPNADEQFGHEPHMIATYLNGERIPVICGAGGRANCSLAEVRVNAGKWALYTQRRMWGQNVLLSA